MESIFVLDCHTTTFIQHIVINSYVLESDTICILHIYPLWRLKRQYNRLQASRIVWTLLRRLATPGRNESLYYILFKNDVGIEI